MKQNPAHGHFEASPIVRPANFTPAVEEQRDDRRLPARLLRSKSRCA